MTTRSFYQWIRLNLDPAFIETIQLQDAINERISKAKAITSLILASHDFADKATLYDLIWVIDDCLIEMSYLNVKSETAFQNECLNF